MTDTFTASCLTLVCGAVPYAVLIARSPAQCEREDNAADWST